MTEHENTLREPPAVSFTVNRTASTLDPFTAIEEANRQAHAELLAREIVVPDDPEAIGFNYHTRRYGEELDVVLVVYGTDELRIRETAQILDARYHPGRMIYEGQVDDS